MGVSRSGRFRGFRCLDANLGSGTTLVNGEVNSRASVVDFLYQVVFEGAAVDDAMLMMLSIWAPNETWKAFIVRVTTDKGVDCSAL